MSEILERLKVVVEANITPLKNAIRRAINESRSMANSVNRDVQSIAGNSIEIGAINTEPAVQSTNKLIEKVRNYVKEAQLASKIKVYSEDYKNVCADIERTKTELEKLNQKKDSFGNDKRFEVSQEFKDLEKIIASTQAQLDKFHASEKKMISSGKDVVTTEEYKEVEKHLKDVQAHLNGLISKQQEWKNIGIPDTASSMKTLLRDIEEARKEMSFVNGELQDMKESGSAFNPTKEFRNLQSEITATKKRLERYREEKKKMLADGTDKVETQKYKDLMYNIKQATKSLVEYNTKKSTMQKNGTDVQYSGDLASQSWLASGVAVASTLPATIGAAMGSATAKVRQLSSNIGQVVGRIPLIGRMAKEAAFLGKTAFSGMQAALKKVSPAIKTAGGAFASLINRFASGIPVIRRFTNTANRMQTTGRGLRGMFQTIGMTAKFMLASFFITGGINAAKTGFKNLAQYSSETNQSISLLWSSLTQLKNALAVAFAPILNYVAPVLNNFIQLLIKAANTAGQFFASLTGQNYALKATKVTKDYASSLSNSANSANKAAEANKNLKRSLLGFDEINKLDDDSSSDSNAGIANSDVSFDTISISGNVSNFAKMLKDAWRNADFSDIGVIVGNKLNTALSNIPWTKIRGTLNKTAKSIATFLNGFIGTTDWKLVGKTVSNCVTTALEFLYTAISTFDWKQLGQSVIRCIKGINWGNIAYQTFQLIGGALGGLGAFLGGVIEEAVKSAKEYFSKSVEDCGGNVVKGILLGIWNGIVGIGKWIKDNIFTPFVDGFKSVFGIHSPATEMEPLGENILRGIILGFTNTISEMTQAISDFFTNTIKPWFTIEKWKENFGSIKDALSSKWKDAVSWWNSKPALANISTRVASIKDKLSESWNTAKNWWKNDKGDLSKLSIGITSIKDKLKESFGSAKNWAKENFKLSFQIDYKTKGLNAIQKGIVNALGLEGWPSFKFYEQGGFPNVGEMFIANEKGPEMIGKMGNRNVVANNNQIADGIASAVYPAVYNAMVAAFQSVGDRQGGNVTVTLAPNAKGLFKVVRTEAQNFYNANGVSPFPT